MSAKAISEYDAKRLVAEHIQFERLANKFKAVTITTASDVAKVTAGAPWVTEQLLIAKAGGVLLKKLRIFECTKTPIKQARSNDQAPWQVRPNQSEN